MLPPMITMKRLSSSSGHSYPVRWVSAVSASSFPFRQVVPMVELGKQAHSVNNDPVMDRQDIP